MSHYDIYAIGNALVDSEYEVSDALLQSMGVDKRHMTLIDTPRRAELLHHVKAMTPRQTGGGSAGNTVVPWPNSAARLFIPARWRTMIWATFTSKTYKLVA
jgi:sugar/nucleoside kinase (ribokinase family)